MIDIILPSYQRPDSLERCLAALGQQQTPATTITVVARATDDATIAVVRATQATDTTVKLALVHEPGILGALAVGVANTSAEIVAFTDDDTEPRPDWIRRIVAHFNDDKVGCVAGRDIVPFPAPHNARIGQWTWFGRPLGGHDRGQGPATEVHYPKGCNMAFRADLLQMPRSDRSLCDGAQPGGEPIMAASVRSAGYQVLYDPAVCVLHHHSERGAHDPRDANVSAAVHDRAMHNVLALAWHPGPRRIIKIMYQLVVGTRRAPGFVRAAVAVGQRDRDVYASLPAALSGWRHGLTIILRREPYRDSAQSLRDTHLRLSTGPDQ